MRKKRKKWINKLRSPVLPKKAYEISFLKGILFDAESILRKRTNDQVDFLIKYIEDLIDKYEIDDIEIYLCSTLDYDGTLSAEEIDELGLRPSIERNCFSRKHNTKLEILSECFSFYIGEKYWNFLSTTKEFPRGKHEEYYAVLGLSLAKDCYDLYTRKNKTEIWEDIISYAVQAQEALTWAWITKTEYDHGKFIESRFKNKISKQRSKAAKKANKPWLEIRKQAIRLAKRRRIDYPDITVRKLADIIKDDVQKYAKMKRRPLSEDRLHITVYEWLRKESKLN